MYTITAAGTRKISFIFLLILISLSLAACTPSPADAPPVETAIESTVEIQTPLPTSTATPEPVINQMILVAGSPQPDAESLLRELAEQNEMELEVLPEIRLEDIQTNWKVIVLLPGYENIGEWVSAAPDVQFVVSSEVDLPVASNLSVIRYRPDHQAFAAGYIGAVITPDWRVAGLLPSDTALSTSLVDAFLNGGYYYCGLCRTLYAPLAAWPQANSLPLNSDNTAWQTALAELEPLIVYGVYVDPRIASPEFLRFLSEKNIVLLGGQTPPAEILSNWAVTVRPEISSALTEMMPSVLAGSGGQVVNAGLELVDVNPRLLSPGRQHLIETMLDDLKAGFIETLILPE